MDTKCPLCSKLVGWEGNVYRPFCSQRCKLLDLDGWLSEHYRFPSEEENELDNQEKPDDTGKMKNGISSL